MGEHQLQEVFKTPHSLKEQLSHFKISVFTGALHEKVTPCCCREDSVFPMVEHVFIQVTENTLITWVRRGKPCRRHRTYIILTYHNISPLILMLPVSWRSHSWLIHVIIWKTIVYPLPWHQLSCSRPSRNSKEQVPPYWHGNGISLGGISNKWGVVLNHHVWIMSSKIRVNNQ